MSDPKYGEPVEENTANDAPTSADAAVASAHEGLADAEAARQAAAQEDAEARAEAVDDLDAARADGRLSAQATSDEVPVVAASDTPAKDRHPHLPHHGDRAKHELDDATRADATKVPAAGSSYDDDPVDEEYVPGAYSTSVTETRTVTETPVRSDADDTPTQAVAPTVVATPQPIFVQAPEAPRPRGNRAAAGAIGLIAAVAFGILYLAAALGLRALNGEISGADIGTEALAALTTWWFWVPVVVFYLAFWLLGAIINRSGWVHWVFWGLLVGVAAYGGHILGQLFQAPFWQLTASQGEDLVRSQVLAPLAIVAFVLGRELTIWFGKWVAARGKRMTELNVEAQREYERTLEAGPRIQQG